eukprot:TRINITY_DN1390_c0_g3_i1.p1 TRINITY_DN1390_c0_g3~~TRINITY_DN1390_c0_g3_i1.p1  ORF type:complete len:624 (-),score=130.18 TRINITY_DN1390_c0_g3_i1:152-2023(-)
MACEAQKPVFRKPILLLVLLVAELLVVSDGNQLAVDRVGVNFVIPPGNTAELLARKAAELGVASIKIWDWSPWTIYQLRKYYTLHQRKLEIMVSIPQWIFAPSDDGLDGQGDPKWELIPDLLHTMRMNSDVVKGVFVYNEPCIKGLCQGVAGENYLKLLGNLSDELKDEAMIVTTPFASYGGILQMPPNQNQLRDAGFMLRLVKILAKTKAPAAVNLYPYLDYIGAEPGAVGLDFAEEKGSNTLFDFDFANLRQALDSLGPDGVSTPIAVGETGWAHDFGPCDPNDYWRRRVKDISDEGHALAFYTNVFDKMPYYVEKYKLYKVWIFEIADEPTKPPFAEECAHGQDHAGWLKYKCGAYDGEKWFGISGLWTDASMSPWNRGESGKTTDAATMRKHDWEMFHGEMVRLEQSTKLGQGCTEDVRQLEKDQLEGDIQLLQKYSRHTSLAQEQLREDEVLLSDLDEIKTHHRRLREETTSCMDCIGAYPRPNSCSAPCDNCSSAIVWAREQGIVKHPEWYQGLSQASRDRDFQMQIHAVQPKKCPKPCAPVVINAKWEQHTGLQDKPFNFWQGAAVACSLTVAGAVTMGSLAWLRSRRRTAQANARLAEIEAFVETHLNNDAVMQE